MSEPYENTLSIEELRREVREAWDDNWALNRALLDLPEVPPLNVLRTIQHAGTNFRGADTMTPGRELQRRFGLDAVPPKSEYERAAGLWTFIRNLGRPNQEPKRVIKQRWS